MNIYIHISLHIDTLHLLPLVTNDLSSHPQTSHNCCIEEYQYMRRSSVGKGFNRRSLYQILGVIQLTSPHILIVGTREAATKCSRVTSPDVPPIFLRSTSAQQRGANKALNQTKQNCNHETESTITDKHLYHYFIAACRVYNHAHNKRNAADRN